MKKLIVFGSVLLLGLAARDPRITFRRNLSTSPSDVLRNVATIHQSKGSGNSSTRGRKAVEVLVGPGDIASCKNPTGAVSTAKLLDGIPGTVFAAGDLAYEQARDKEFSDCYDKTWGRHRARTRPAAGNHEYGTEGASGYFRYFGAAAGDPRKGYYSYDLGVWHVVVINSNCEKVGGCQSGSPQEKWLRRDLASHPAPCTLAYWHHPLFSSGINPRHAIHPEMKAIWHALHEAGAEVVVNGHEHNYDRFAPQDPNGMADPAGGIREFVVGTGDKDHTPFGAPIANSEKRNADTFGVLKLTLRPSGYNWEFFHATGKTFTDFGSGVCH
jgi:hypothetical protein